jgi:tetratricopeptide (TPR) repeat protein
MEVPTSADRSLLVEVPVPDLSDVEENAALQITEARERFDTRIAQPELGDAELAAVYGGMGKIYQAWELYEAGEACYRNAELLAPQDHTWPYLLANLYRSKGDFQESIAALERTLALKPDDLAAKVRLGNLLFDENRLDEARSQLEDVLAADQNEAAAHFGLGQISLAEEDPQAAVEHLETALELSPQASRIHYPLGLAYRQLGDEEKAQSHLDASGMVEPAPQDPIMEEAQALREGSDMQKMRAAAAYHEGNIPAALAELQEAVVRTPEDPSVHLNLGTVLATIGEFDEAGRHFRESLRLTTDPQVQTRVHLNLGNLATVQGSHEIAADHYRAAIELDPGLIEAYINLAGCLARLDQPDDALAQIDALLAIDPAAAQGHVARAQLLYRQGRYAEARQSLEQSHQTLSSDMMVASALARMLATCPDPEVRDGTRAAELALSVYSAAKTPANAAILAMALAEQGEFEAAFQLQQAAIIGLQKAGRPELARSLEKNLLLYRQGKPVRIP